MYQFWLIGQHIRLYSQQLDHMMGMLYEQYFDINLSTHVQMETISLISLALTY